MVPIAPAHVTGGEAAPPGAWPDAAAVVYPWGVGCSGVLVLPDVVVTAGHCAKGATRVVLGTTDYEVGGETIDVAEVVSYPDSATTFDVALLKLATPATSAPRPLALDCVAAWELVDGAEVAIVGFGATDLEGEQYGSILEEGDTVVDDALCEAVGRGCRTSISPGGELLAGGDGVDSCNGDSGGPLYLDSTQGWLLAGVTSRAAVPASTPCGDGGIYVRADAIAPWIEQTTGETLPRPTCDGWEPNHAPAPTAGAIEVDAGGTASTVIAPNDPDAADTHTYRLLTAPKGGDVTLGDDGTFTYAAADDFSGEDVVTVGVTDDGAPPMHGSVDVTVNVAGGTGGGGDDDTGEPRGGCGCAAGEAAGRHEIGGVLLTALLVLRKRRRAC